jgi:hypothetical protein
LDIARRGIQLGGRPFRNIGHCDYARGPFPLLLRIFSQAGLRALAGRKQNIGFPAGFRNASIGISAAKDSDFHGSKLLIGAARNGAADSGKAPQISGQAGKRKGASGREGVGQKGRKH